ncbi:Acg family FMN-binding oxidoreductase [Saccharopolyspora sp. MS10]|uniref:Acg family FMN-binding oxidoreductase n=1 Tax=Saccharopolyspora sp. MS10 TaxID=3385973 RepID=UPI0039A050D6
MAGRRAPTAEEMCEALALAGRAPSVHNSQPWRWRLHPRSAHLLLDLERTLGALDPTGREAIVSCGAVLHHACVVFRADGWTILVHRLPNPAMLTHLATIEFAGSGPRDPGAGGLAAAVPRRRTDRRPFSSAPVPRAVVERLVSAAEDREAELVPVLDAARRRDLMLAIDEAGDEQRRSSRYREELAAWTGRRSSRGDGIPAGALPRRRTPGMPARDFAAAGELVVPDLDDGATLAVLSTGGDSFESWLAAGEALSSVLLAAAGEGLAACPLSQIAEVGGARSYVRDRILGGEAHPQLALRLGWPASTANLGPPTPRRPIGDFVHVSRDAGA